MTMQSVVITGSTRGLGYHLAGEFLRRGCRVVISGRGAGAVDQAVERLAETHGPDRVIGQPCDVTSFEAVQALWETAQARCGRIDIWINNAGLAQPAAPMWTLDPALVRAIIDTNLTGLIYGSQVAAGGMIAQGGGRIFNLEGYGSNGSMRRQTPLSIYGSSKAAVRYISRALALEIAETGVRVGTMGPGMLATDLVVRQYDGRPEEWQRVKRILNIFAERPETVAPWLVERVLAGTRQGAHIEWLTPLRLFGYFALAPFRKRDVFAGLEPD